MLGVVGLLNIVQGLPPCSTRPTSSPSAADGLLIGDFTTWGIVLLIWGGSQVAAGMGLNSGHGWARVLALVIASVGIIVQMLFLAAYPIWSIVIIALDVIVIFALTARWSEARAGL